MKQESTSGLFSDLNYLKENLSAVMHKGIVAFKPPDLKGNSEYTHFVNEHKLNVAERLLLLLAIAQYAEPELCENLIVEKNTYRILEKRSNWLVLPSGATFLKLFAPNSAEERIKAHSYLDTAHLFYRKGIVTLGEVEHDVSAHLGALKINYSYKDLFLYNTHRLPPFSQDFPAHHLQTDMEWEDLVVNATVAKKLNELRQSLLNRPKLQLVSSLAKRSKKGRHCLFYGPSGTGKTMAATLIGKYLNREVFSIDLSAVISKYVGDTSKNLASLFNMAEDKDWVLLFDEGDALFGKRIDSGQAEDKNASNSNQVVAYLLHRIEQYKGLIIVSSNLPKNMDQAFSRRFAMTIKFDLLSDELSKKFWLDNLPQEAKLAPGINLDRLIAEYKLSPAQIINVIERIWLITINRDDTVINQQELELCIKDEAIK